MNTNLLQKQTTHKKKISFNLNPKIYIIDAIVPKEQMVFPIENSQVCVNDRQNAKISFKVFSYNGTSYGLIKQNDQEDNKYKIYNGDGTLYNTKVRDIIRNREKKGAVPYVIGCDGKLRILHSIEAKGISDLIELYAKSHSLFQKGEPVVCAGMMTIHNGRIVRMTTENSHYQVSHKNLYNAVKFLDKAISKDARIVHKGIEYNKESLIKIVEDSALEKNKTKSYFATAVTKFTNIFHSKKNSKKNCYDSDNNVNNSSNNLHSILKKNVNTNSNYVQRINQERALSDNMIYI